jgi:hypothetical protein
MTKVWCTLHLNIYVGKCCHDDRTVGKKSLGK